MKTVNFEEIVKKVKNASISMQYNISPTLMKYYNKSILVEDVFARETIQILKKNALLAKSLEIPLCQDTGTIVAFIDIGNEISIENGLLKDAIFQGVKEGYSEGYLRKSIVNNPIERKNTKNNLPAIIHYDITKGNKLIINLCAKGAGSENMSDLKMLSPGDGIAGIQKFVIKTIINAGANACPPIIVGVGIGSNFEGVALLAKKALFRPLNKKNSNPKLHRIELDLEDKINKTGIGPQGLGGKITAFRVHVLMEPCHIASLPVAVNINCHIIRHRKLVF